MDQKSCTNIKVAIRIRPFLPDEHAKKLCAHWATQNNIIYQIDDSGHKFGDGYSFDHIFGMDKTNGEIYTDVVKEFVDSTMDGLNSTIFAYGQTSSGKTYTMLGDKKDTGVMALAIEHIFQNIENNHFRKFLIRVSYMEIYNEKINDLLDANNKDKDVRIREYPQSTIGLQNMKEELVSTREQMYDCLKRGNLKRHIGSTHANARSSRSHTIFKIMIESTQVTDFDSSGGSVQVSNLNLVDLAGSERVAQTQATGMRLKEGSLINKSLSALSLVIKQLSEGQEYVNFRDSKLTRLLQDSIGGNSKTLIIATITLASIEDTATTLAFAQRAKTVKNKPHVNEILTDADVSKRYAALNTQLQKKLEEQMRINQTLRVTKEENEKEMTRLQQQMEMLEDFQHGSHTPESKPIPKRRHTIGFSAQKLLTHRFSSSDVDKNIQDSENPVMNFAPKYSTTAVPTLEPILEDECLPPHSKNAELTPPSGLRIRLSALEQDYNELLMFTRDEENIFEQTSHELDKMRKQLAESQAQRDQFKQKLEEAEKELIEYNSEHEMAKFWKNKYRLREKELCSRIIELERDLEQPDKHDSIFDNASCTDILKQLISLQTILKNSDFINDTETVQEKSPLQLIEKFNAKVKISKDIIESAILRQINNFDHDVEQRTLPDELASFNDLLTELSLIESDIPPDLVNNMKKWSIEDLKILIKIYEFLLRKNESTRQFSEKIKSLEYEKEELRLKVTTFQEEKASFADEIDKLKCALQIQTEDLDSVTSDLFNTGELCTKLKDEKAKLEQLLADSENSFIVLRRENELLKSEIENNAKSKELQRAFDTLPPVLENDKTLESKKNLHSKINEFICETVKNTSSLSESERAYATLEEEIKVLKKENTSLVVENEFNTDVSIRKNYMDNMSEITNNDKVDEVTCNHSNLKQEYEWILSENLRLKKQINKLEEAEASYHEKIQSVQEEINKLTLEVEKKETLISALENDCRVLKKEIEILEQNSSSFMHEAESLKLELDKLSRESSEKDNAIQTFQGNIKKMLEETKNLQKNSENVLSENELQKKEIKVLQNQIDFLNLEINKQTTLLDTLKQDNDFLTLKIADLNLASEELKQTVDKCSLKDTENNKIKEEFQKNLKENQFLKEKLENIKTCHESYRERIDSLENEVKKLNLETRRKNEELKETIDKCSLKDAENKKIRNEFEQNLKENQFLKEKLEKIKASDESCRERISSLENKIKELHLETKRKNEELTETIDKCSLKDAENKKIRDEFEQNLKENNSLRQELEIVQTCSESYRERISSLENTLGKLNSESKKKNELEKRASLLKQDVVRLRKEISELSFENTALKREVANLRMDSEKMSLEITENNRLKHEARTKNVELYIKLENLERQLVDQEQLKTEITNLKNNIEKCNEINGISEQRMTQNECKLQQQKQLLHNAQKQISALKEDLAEKEKIKCENSQYKMQIMLNNKKIDEYLQVNEQLRSEIKQLQSLNNNCDTGSSAKVTYKEEEQNDIRCLNRQLEDILCNVIEQFINEQKALLLTRHSQNERDRFKNILKDLKSCHTILKSQLRSLRDGNNVNLNQIKKYLSRSREILNQYFTMEKSFIQEQIGHLEVSNKAYLQEIMVLKETSGHRTNGVCQQCDSLKTELLTLKEKITSQEQTLLSLKVKNNKLGQDNTDRMKEIVRLQTQIYDEQDRKAEIAYTDWLKFCEDNYKIAQREAKSLAKQVQTLEEQLKFYKKTSTMEKRSSVGIQCEVNHIEIKNQTISGLKSETKNFEETFKTAHRGADVFEKQIKMLEEQLRLYKKSPVVNCNSVEVQCDFHQEDAILQEKYNKMKQVCVLRNRTITQLKSEINKLQNLVDEKK